MANGINNLAAPLKTAYAALEEAPPAECKTLHTPRSVTEAPIHVLFIIDELCEMGGAERVLLKTVRLLPRELFRCSVLTFRINEQSDEVRNIACSLHVLPLKKTYDWNALKVARQIRRFVKEHKVSIVQTFHETSDLWAGPIAKLSGCPVLVSSRRDLGILRSRKHRIGYKVMRRFYDTVLAVSPQVKQFCVQEDGLDATKVHTLFSGLEMERVAKATNRAIMRRRLDISEEAPVIITVGNIRRVKGVDVLVEAAGLVCRKHPSALFLVVGRKSETEYCQELLKRIASLGLDGNFRFLGSREDVFSLLRMSDVFCLPSRSEGFSNALIEAMGSRLPCVVTDVGGNSEVLKHGGSGFLVASEDAEDMAARLIYLLDDPGLAAEMGLQGEKVIRAGFTAEAMIGNLVNLYRELLRGKKHSA